MIKSNKIDSFFDPNNWEIGELANQMLIDIEEKRENLPVVLKDGSIGFPEYDYWIELSRIPDQAVLIHWLLHLLTKEYLSKDFLSIFILVVCREKDWKIYRHIV